MSEQAAPAKAAAQLAQATETSPLTKLIIFALALGLGPLGSYYGSLAYLWDGNTTYAGITAVFVANGVLAAYIIVSIIDDKKDQDAVKAKKSQ